ncbi:leucine-rich repeat-containing protein 57-like [Littorina saxatilis]|uniref:Leucine-rich repeat-containing protein 57 n=1 Tax=Littorina saxatilis TaxID=31220 RepID=A0AAN9BC37_9CAEN
MGNSPSNSPKVHLETARKSKACQLSKLKLEQLPPELEGITELRTLDMSQNKLQILPPWINKFTQLRGLILSHNKLGSLPEVGDLKKLESFIADYNQITRLPSSFANLTSLKTLNLSHNLLTAFPVQLCKLRNLDVVDLSGNRITDVPAEVGDLQAVELNLNQNQVSNLPESLADCPRLKVVRLEENCLPITAFGPRIMKDSKISLFSVEGNVFDSKAFHNLEGYEQYMERYTATKKKFN